MVIAQDLQVWKDYLFTASRILAKCEAQMQAEAGMSLSDFDVLVTLHEAKAQTLSMLCLKETVLVTTSGLSRSVLRLEQRGWINKIPCPEDKRQVYISLTDVGREIIANARKVHGVLVEEIFFSAVSSKDIRGMELGLSHLADHLKTRP